MFKGIQHTGFITNDIEKCFNFYTKLPGVKVVFPLHIEDGYVIKKLSGYKKEGGLKGVKLLYLRDPDGRPVELMQFPE